MAEALALKVIPSFVEAVIGSNLSNLASNELGLLVGVRGEITYLIVELQMMKAFLRSAEEKQETDFMAREWVRLVREVSLDMENCMDKFKIYLNRRPNRNFIDWLGSRLHSLRMMRVRHEIAVEIQDLKYRVSHISDCRLRYGIAATTSGSSMFGSVVATRFHHQLDALFTPEAQLVGIDHPRENLINLLIIGDQQRRVISVLGMGGLGKTTLTKRVYEDPQIVGGYFDCRAWITVSQSFNLNILLKDIFKQVSSVNSKMRTNKNYDDKIETKEDIDNIQSTKDIIKKLVELLEMKCYIIVLDDIWSIDAWESIKHALPKNHKRSRVIITTRIEDVAKHCCDDDGVVDSIYRLQLLSMEESMELFQKRVFGPEKLCPMHLNEVSNEVIKKCGGLPLAIVAIAGVLKSMPDDKQQWSNILDNLPSMLETNLSLEGMKQVMLLSYNNLPYLLKPCFLYLSIFPEDHIIKRKNLIQLWIAEGLVTNQYAMSAEVVAEYYFNELVSRNLIMPLVVGWNGKVKSCRIHDVMLEVLVFKSMKENMVLIHGKQSRTTSREGNTIRRLSLQGEINQIRCISDDMDLSKVTSLSIYDFPKIPTYFLRFRLLRVLVLEYNSFEEGQKVVFLRFLSKFWNLRYLSLKGTNLQYLSPREKHQIESTPEPIRPVILRFVQIIKKTYFTFSKYFSKLRNLVTLDIRGTNIYVKHSSLAKFRQLRHCLTDEIGFNLDQLKPTKFKNLKDLQTFVCLHIENIGMAEELGFLTQLRVLNFSVNVKKPEILKSLCVSLDKLSGSLISLRINFFGGLKENLCSDFDINNLPSLLQRLHLSGLYKIPNWVSSLSNLAKLTIRIDGNQLVNDLGVIKTLPNLLYLTFSCYFRPRGERVEALLIPSGGFKMLKILKIHEMHQLYAVEFQKECMPILEKIVIQYSRLNSVIGIRFLPCLQEIRLDWVSKNMVEQLKLDVEKLKFDAEPRQKIPKLIVINEMES